MSIESELRAEALERDGHRVGAMNITDLPEQMQTKIMPVATGCWLWSGYVQGGGYGQVWLEGKTVYSHRVAYELLVGAIPKGLQVDHLCRVRSCCNPSHMEPVTPAENVRRGDSGQRQLVKTHCPRGHPYSGKNLYVVPATGGRECRICHRASNKAYRNRKGRTR